MPKIYFTREKITKEVKANTPLWEIEDIEFVKEKNCGGQGRCLQCRCLINGESKTSCTTKTPEVDTEITTLIAYDEE